MNGTKHTPGPWRLSGPDDFNDYTIQPPNAELAIAAVVNGAMWHMGGKSNEHEANARLIAAAPELLEALEKITHYAECQIEAFKSGRPFLDMTAFRLLCPKARAAIAKATGGAA